MIEGTDMDDRALSTSNDISSIIKSGHIHQSPFSEAFIQAVKSRMGLDVSACYLQTGEYHRFCGGAPTDDFVHEVLVTLYVRESSLQAVQAPNEFDREIETVFWNTVRALGLQWSYQRVYSQEELAYYNFANRPRSQWDMGKFQQSTHPPRKSFAVKVESLDRAALYRLLSDNVAPVGRYIRKVSGCHAQVYVGFSKMPPYPATHYLVFETQKKYEHFLSLVRPEAIAADVQEYLQTKDPWGVLETWPYHPQFRVWHEFSDEEKMCLLREAHA